MSVEVGLGVWVRGGRIDKGEISGEGGGEGEEGGEGGGEGEGGG